jgi:hypothetical protein
MNMNESMNLWQKLEIRGRDEFQLDDSMCLYAVDLQDGNRAHLKFAYKNNGQFATGYTVEGYVRYLDLR